MSYDIRICVKADGLDKYVVYDIPEYDTPTYNLGEMFRVCMDWDYEQGEYYKCSEIIGNIEKGITELKTNREKYKCYEPSNGWGNVDSAIEALESARVCIYECAENIPINHLYFRW